MIKPRTLFHWVGWFLVTGISLLLFTCSVVVPSSDRWKLSHEISTELGSAKSVTFVEFTTTYFDQSRAAFVHHETLLNKLVATPQQVQDFCSATSEYLVVSDGSISIAGCFVPHHRIQAVRQNGSIFQMDICFHCRNLQIGGGFDQPIPSSWLAPLGNLFTKLGMPPRTDDEYYQIASTKLGTNVGK